MSRETVQISLLSNSTAGYVINNTAYGFVSFACNWDTIFNNLNKKYRQCFVRIHLQSSANITETTVAAATGVISLIGLGNANSYAPDIGGLVISDLTYTNSNVISLVETGYFISSDTRANAVAPQVPTPQGTGVLTVKISTLAGAIMPDINLARYLITIIFELFDEI
jgi:hypothetical protein